MPIGINWQWGLTVGESELLTFPDYVTESSSEFHKQHVSDMLLFSASELLANHHEKFFLSPRGEFNQSGFDPEALRRHLSKTMAYREQINETRATRAEVAIVRTVENFLCYITDVLTEAMIACPQLLKSQEQVTMADVLEHSSIEEFVHWAAEQHVARLSFKGLSEIAEYIAKRLGLPVHTNRDDWETVKRAVAIRNLIVHRRSRIDERFIRSMASFGVSLVAGERYVSPPSMLPEVMKCTKRIVGDFDLRVAKKFNVPLFDINEVSWFAAPTGPKVLKEVPLVDKGTSETEAE
ncbi:hypothetical protein [Streptomyces atroolivaceus]|uniref:Apea-like HEPN domain-containing protein n=1 Tax=Streptomyces atroolivaceus TaxID=66869 RepID=A0ABV9VAY4_STRAZ|nr:hypothetical protein [Streptomyces atroolivaceus]